ncbi:MAG: SocA family protein [Planctomycetaceae bacterium]|nr:SocA family protein [Planctomycetaceae bacterium]
MSHDAYEIAAYFMKKAEDSKKQITPMQLLKLVYIAHGWHLAIESKPLINDRIEAWKYGPVIPALYHIVKHYGSMEIPFQAFAFAPSFPEESVTKQILDRVWDRYSNFSGFQLSTLTHQKGTPWWDVWHDERGSDHMGAIIPNEKIENHYTSLSE